MNTVSIILTATALCAVGYPTRAFLRWANVPPAVSLMGLGVLCGPSGFDLLPEVWLQAGASLSKAAFVVLLLRAGLGLPRRGIRRLIAPSVLFGSVPVAVEIVAVTILCRLLLFESVTACLLAGFLTAAISPAVILPTMLQQKERGRGEARRVPERIVGQTLVNAFIAQTGILLLIEALRTGAPVHSFGASVLLLPLSVGAGLVVGIVAATGLCSLALDAGRRRTAAGALPQRGSAVVILLLGLAVYFGCSSARLESVFATLAVGAVVARRRPAYQPAMTSGLKTLWQFAEIILFTNLGAQIRLEQLSNSRSVPTLLVIIVLALAFRLLTAAFLAQRTSLTDGERSYVTISHVPKATIQAVFGALPLAVFQRHGHADLLEVGGWLLAIAVAAIVATAPVGAFLLERLAPRLLDARRSDVRTRPRTREPRSPRRRESTRVPIP